ALTDLANRSNLWDIRFVRRRSGFHRDYVTMAGGRKAIQAPPPRCAGTPAAIALARFAGTAAWWDTRGYLPAPAASANRERAAEPPRPGHAKRPLDALRQYPS